MKIRNAENGWCIPDAIANVYYTIQELNNCVEIESDDVTGDITVQLVDGRVACIYSIDCE